MWRAGREGTAVSVQKIGSPECTVSRTLQIFLNRSPRKPAKPRRCYRNPICVALEWQRLLDSGEVPSRAELARRVGVSRARVTQVLRLLRLNSRVLESLIALGDPLPGRAVCERILRALVILPAEAQEAKTRMLVGGTTFRKSSE